MENINILYSSHYFEDLNHTAHLLEQGSNILYNSSGSVAALCRSCELWVRFFSPGLYANQFLSELDKTNKKPEAR